MKPYDLVIIGGGSAGYAAARTAAALNLSVAVIEGGREVGGLCVLRGCMPTKALLESAHRLHDLQRAGEFGLTVSGARADWKKIQRRKDALVGEFAAYRRAQLEKGNFVFIRGQASFVDRHTLTVTRRGGKKFTVSGRAFIIATGSTVSARAVPGLRETGFITSDEALRLDRPPASIAVLGGGAVALEFAQYFQRLGVKTTLIQRSGQVLSSQDADLANVLTDVFRREGMKVRLGTELLAVRKSGHNKQVRFRQNGRTLTVTVTEILCALGRTPRVTPLLPANAGVRLDGQRVQVNRALRTSQPHIFAAGDVCGPHEAAHLAVQQGETAARNAARLLRGDPRREKMDYRLTMEIVFTSPELAAVGLSEKAAAARGRAVLVAKYPFNDHGKSLIMGATDGFVKLIAAAADGAILGTQIVGPHASELIHELVVAMNYRATVSELLRIPHYHPTLAEILTYPAEELAAAAGR
ncbi:MAG: dihydrolipoyl dehydrogenase [Verrucomicrobiales bacterium]|jgi:pyruvate/2-oxoglutarate dehydrogenase complex dihydrolipoamide dehydrogenase (E3) component|nr:dihydrolipoyl dehydrogenase [Verrucomicrobiales bacterium]